MLAYAVDDREVVGHVAGDPAQGGDRVAGALAGLQQVAHDERHAEALAADPAAAERQRDGEPRRVDAVGRTCDGLHGRDHRAAGPGAAQHLGLAQARVEVVVADQDRAVPVDEDGLGAMDQIGGRIPEGEEAGRDLVPAGQLDLTPPDGQQLGHMPPQLLLRVRHAALAALAQIPGAPARATPPERLLPCGAGPPLVDGREGQFHEALLDIMHA